MFLQGGRHKPNRGFSSRAFRNRGFPRSRYARPTPRLLDYQSQKVRPFENWYVLLDWLSLIWRAVVGIRSVVAISITAKRRIGKIRQALTKRVISKESAQL